MHLERIRIGNLGPLKDVVLPLQLRFNALVGVNGSGKSTVLNALALMLQRYSSVVRTGRVSGTVFSRDQIKRGMAYARMIVTGRDKERSSELIEWSMGVA